MKTPLTLLLLILLGTTYSIGQNPSKKDSVLISKSTSDTRYHKDGCDYLDKSNQVLLKDSAKAHGYLPCSKCHGGTPMQPRFNGSVTCNGVSPDGKKCNRKTENKNGRCWEHQK